MPPNRPNPKDYISRWENPVTHGILKKTQKTNVFRIMGREMCHINFCP